MKKKGFAIASLLLGIVATLFSCCIGYIAIPCAIVGATLGIISLSKRREGV